MVRLCRYSVVGSVRWVVLSLLGVWVILVTRQAAGATGAPDEGAAVGVAESSAAASERQIVTKPVVANAPGDANAVEGLPVGVTVESPVAGVVSAGGGVSVGCERPVAAESAVSGPGRGDGDEAGLLSPVRYVDVLAGIELNPPAESRPMRQVGPVGTAGTEGLSWVGLGDWSLAKVPPSKELVGFVQESTGRCLSVSVVATRSEFTTEQLCQARRAYWLSRPDRVATVRGEPGVSKGRAVGRLALLWRRGEGSDVERVYELLLQRQPDRFFLLSLFNVGDGEEDDPNVSLATLCHPLLDAVAGSLVELPEKELKSRWEQARRHAQGLLGRVTQEQLAAVLPSESWYIISRGGREIGFQCVRGRVVGADGEPDQLVGASGETDQRVNELTTMAYVDNAADAHSFAGANGWVVWNAAELDRPVGATVLTVSSRLNVALGSEEFSVDVAAFDRSRGGCRLKGRWQGSEILVTSGSGIDQGQEGTPQSLSVNNRIYLPWTMGGLLGCLVGGEVGSEYVFMRYAGQAVGYYCVRVADVAAGSVGEESGAADGLDSHSPGAVHVVGRSDTDGTIVEMWLDAKGNIVREHLNELTIEVVSADRISSVWPEQYGRFVRDMATRED